MSLSPKLLTTDTSALLLVDYQQHVLNDVQSHDQELIEFQGKALARAGRTFGVPTILSTIGQKLRNDDSTLPSIREELPELEEVDRNTMNSWDDTSFRKAVEDTGRRRLIFAGLTTEVCLQMPVLHAQRDGYETYFVADAVGAPTMVEHDMAIRRMIQAGSQPLTVNSLVTEWIRDWAENPWGQATIDFMTWYKSGIAPIHQRLRTEPFRPVLT